MARSKERAAQGEQLGGDPLDGPDEAASLPARIGRYSSARARAVAMVAHLDEEGHVGQVPQVPHLSPLLHRARGELRSCGNYLLFHHYWTVGKVRLAAMRSCRIHLLCPLCAIRRGAKSLGAYLQRFEAIVAERASLSAWMVTFTVTNGPDLVERFKHLQGSLQRLHNRRRHWLKGTRGAGWTEAAKAAGAVWSFEVTNRGKGWHPHAHAIWLCEDRPDRWALVEEWKAITGDSCIVDVRPIDQEEPAEGFAEVFKYALKAADLTLSQNVAAWLALRGRRLVGSFGCFRGVQVPEEMTDELLDDLPYVELLYRYSDLSGYSLQHCSEPVNPASEASAVGQD